MSENVWMGWGNQWTFVSAKFSRFTVWLFLHIFMLWSVSARQCLNIFKLFPIVACTPGGVEFGSNGCAHVGGNMVTFPFKSLLNFEMNCIKLLGNWRFDWLSYSLHWVDCHLLELQVRAKIISKNNDIHLYSIELKPPLWTIVVG